MRKELRPVHDLVACDLCDRTILKGERIETFVGGGGRQHVCELCSLRALRAGWLRESDIEQREHHSADSGPRRSLWSRARNWAEDQGLWGAPPATESEAGEADRHAERAARRHAERRPRPVPVASAGEAADLRGPEETERLDEAERHRARRRETRPASALEEPWETTSAPDGDEHDAAAWGRRPARPPNPPGLRDLIAGRRRDEPREVQAVPTSREGKVERALELFNESEHRRTIAGVGRALGEPWVSASPLDEGPTAREVGIVVAWELSWYRYRVDLDDPAQAVLLLDRGDEVEDLDAGLRFWNAAADSDGRLALAFEAVS